MPKLLCTLETTQTILSTFHATADQQHCRERVLCSTKADMDLWNPIFKNYQKCFHGLFVAISLDQSIKVTLVIYEKRDTFFRPDDCATNALRRTLHTSLSEQLDGPLKRSSKNPQHFLKRENQTPQSHLHHWGRK